VQVVSERFREDTSTVLQAARAAKIEAFANAEAATITGY
jgi:hypothetical protein